jgi:hypothetical protein
MPYYFFQARYHGETVTADTPEEFSTLQEAEAHGAIVAAELSRNNPEQVVVSVLTEGEVTAPISYRSDRRA